MAVSSSCWFAVRVTGEPARGILPGIPRAQSGAIYVHVGGQPTLIKEDVELMIRWVDRLWLYLEERNNLGPGDNRARARKIVRSGARTLHGQTSQNQLTIDD